MNWIKDAIRKMVKEELAAPQETRAADVLSGCELAFVAYKIDNGYLLRIGNALAYTATSMVYCKDEAAISERLVAHRAKEKMGVVTRHNTPTYASAVGASTAPMKSSSI